MRTLLIAAAALFACSLAAHADTQTYSYSTHFTSEVYTYGSLFLDTTTGQFTGISGSYFEPNMKTETLYQISSQGVVNGDYELTFGADNIELFFPTASLTSYMGGEICSMQVSANCGTNRSSVIGFGTALEGGLTLESTTPSSVTPEPSSIALLGTGMLGIAGLIKRRLV